MSTRKVYSFSDWDDWSDDGPEWWLLHPLHRPRPTGGASRAVGDLAPSKLAKRITVA